MLLRNSISNTKKLFRKTIESFKSFVSKNRPYERLETNPIDDFYKEFTHQWDSKKSSKKLPAAKQSTEVYPRKKGGGGGGGGGERKEQIVKREKRVNVRERRVCLAEEKLRELEMIVEKGNVEYRLDVEEFLHYYSQLTCPVFLEFVDSFLKQISAEFLGPQEVTHHCELNNQGGDSREQLENRKQMENRKRTCVDKK